MTHLGFYIWVLGSSPTEPTLQPSCPMNSYSVCYFFNAFSPPPPPYLPTPPPPVHCSALTSVFLWELLSFCENFWVSGGKMHNCLLEMSIGVCMCVYVCSCICVCVCPNMTIICPSAPSLWLPWDDIGASKAGVFHFLMEIPDPPIRMSYLFS